MKTPRDHVFQLDLHRYVFAACAKVCVDGIFPQRCKKDEVTLLISFPEWINIVVDCGNFAVGMFLLLTADLRNSCLNFLGNNWNYFGFSFQIVVKTREHSAAFRSRELSELICKLSTFVAAIQCFFSLMSNLWDFFPSDCM